MDLTRTSPTRRASRVLLLALAALAAALALGVAAQDASADNFECRGSALRVDATALGLISADAEPVVANAGAAPCAPESRRLLTLPAALDGVVGGGVAEAETGLTTSAASARGTLTDVGVLRLLAGGIGANAIEATAGYQCVDGSPVAQSGGHVAGLTLFGTPVADTSQPVTLDLSVPVLLATVRIGEIALNETRTTATSVTRAGARISIAPSLDLGLLGPILNPTLRALLGSLLGTDIVIGEARAALVGNPCPPVPDPSGPTDDPVDPTLRAPVIDDAPAKRSPLDDATFLYHSTDAGVAFECRLDSGPWEPCDGSTTYNSLSVGDHCFYVRTRRSGRVSPTTSYCWTIFELAPGCIANFRHGYFINAKSARIANRRMLFHATTNGAEGRIDLRTRTGKGRLRGIVYRLDGDVVGRGPRAQLRYAQLSRDGRHVLRVRARVGRRRKTITRTFRYLNYVAVDCDGREVVGPLRAKTVRVGRGRSAGRVAVVPTVPRTIQGTDKLRFRVKPSRRHLLSRVHFSLNGKTIRQHIRSVAFTGRQLRENGTQTLVVRLVPRRRGRVRTVTIAFRTEKT